MKQINWNAETNQFLISERGVSFEDVLIALQSGRLLDDLVQPNNEKYPDQPMLVAEIDGYAWLVPYVENGEEIFLKIVIPSRKATKRYLKGEI